MSKCTDHIVIRRQDKLILFDENGEKVREFLGERFDFSLQHLFA